MADNTYFKNAQAITNTVLDYLEKNNEFNEDDYYQIDILDLDEGSARVLVQTDVLAQNYLYVAKNDGVWTVPALNN